jgi:hypothetical protein
MRKRIIHSGDRPCEIDHIAPPSFSPANAMWRPESSLLLFRVDSVSPDAAVTSPSILAKWRKHGARDAERVEARRSRERSLDRVRRAAYTVDEEQRRTSGRRPVIARPWREHVALAAIEAARAARAGCSADADQLPRDLPIFSAAAVGNDRRQRRQRSRSPAGSSACAARPDWRIACREDLEAERSSLAEQRELL